MQFNAQVAAAILGFVSIACATEHHHGHLHHRRQVLQEKPNGEVGFQAASTPTSSTRTHTMTQAAPSTTKAPSTTLVTSHSAAGGTQSASDPAHEQGDLTINVENKYGTPLSLVYGNNAGGPSANGNPSNGMLATSTSVVFPTGWAGRMTLGKDGNPAGSKIEGSFNGLPNIDVSYVDGYSVPIVCSCSKTPVTGCNIDLFNTGRQCPQMEGSTCINTISGPDPNGPAQSFFQPCQGAAYTYPNDNLADEGCQTHTINCCIGTSCPTVARQPMKNSS